MDPRSRIPSHPDAPVSNLLLRHRRPLARLLLVAAVGLPLLLFALAIGPYGDDAAAQRFLVVYMAPMITFGGVWARRWLAGLDEMSAATVRLDVLTFVAAGLRAIGSWGVLAYSGHMLFLTYALLVTPGRGLRLAALALLGLTTWFKLAVWGDWTSWMLGLSGGIALAAARELLARRDQPGVLAS
jgi:hypothetical protein